MGEVQRKVRVELGPDSYEIIIGRNLNAELQEFVKGAGFSQPLGQHFAGARLASAHKAYQHDILHPATHSFLRRSL